MAIKLLIENRREEPLAFIQECRYCKSLLEYTPEDTSNDPYWEKYIECPSCHGHLPIVDNPSTSIEVDLDKQCGFYYHATVLIPDGVRVFIPSIEKDNLVLTEVDCKILPLESSFILIGNGKVKFRTLNANINANTQTTIAQVTRTAKYTSGFTTITSNLKMEYHNKVTLLQPTTVYIPGEFKNLVVKEL